MSQSVPHAFRRPRWLQVLHYTLDPLAYLSEGFRRCGDIFHAPVIGNPKQLLIVSDPAAIKTIFTTDTKQLFAPANQLLQPIVGDRSIFGLEHARHRRERKLLLPPFHRDHVAEYGSLIIELTHQILKSLPSHQPFKVRDLMQDITLEVILKVVFGLDSGPRFTQLKDLIVQLTEGFQAPGVAFALFLPKTRQTWNQSWQAFLTLKRRIGEFLLSEIRNRRQSPHLETSIDILSLLIQAQDEMGEHMSDAELCDELMTLLLAGHETTATAISWAMYWVHRDRRVLETLLSELNDATEDPKAIAQLPYLTAVCNEALRIYPVAILTVPREVQQPISLLGYDLEPGTRLYGGIYTLHHQPDLYANPEKFLPERFLDRQYSNFEFIPFGGGARRCIGEVLAQFEMKLILATMLRNRTFSLVNSEPEIPKRRGVTLAPGQGVPMMVHA